jgi:hypothetical protein
MNLYVYSIAWRYSSENFEYGIIKANSEKEAEEILKRINPTAIHVSAWEPEFDSDGTYSVYSH